LQYRHANRLIKSGDNVAIHRAKKKVKFDPVTPVLTRVEIEIFATSGQKQGKNRISQQLLDQSLRHFQLW